MFTRCGMLLLYCCVLGVFDCKVKMKDKRLGKIINGFRIAGIIVAPIYGIVGIIRELTAISWSFDAWKSIVGHAWSLFTSVVMFLACLFLMWVLHIYGMFFLHKMFPDTYDERGHRRD